MIGFIDVSAKESELVAGGGGMSALTEAGGSSRQTLPGATNIAGFSSAQKPGVKVSILPPSISVSDGTVTGKASASGISVKAQTSGSTSVAATAGNNKASLTFTFSYNPL